MYKHCSSCALPLSGRYWETVQRLKINQFYGAPTAIRLLLKYGDQWVHRYDRSSLKTLGSGTGAALRCTSDSFTVKTLDEDESHQFRSC